MRPHLLSATLGLVLGMARGQQFHPDATDCYNDMSQDGAMCDDRDPSTPTDECYQGACGSWVMVESIISSEADRLAWAQADPTIGPTFAQNCYECGDRTEMPSGPAGPAPGTYPKYLALDPSGDHGHGQASTNRVVHSW